MRADTPTGPPGKEWGRIDSANGSMKKHLVSVSSPVM